MRSVSDVPPYPYGVYVAGKDGDNCLIQLRPHECSIVPTSDEECLRESLVSKPVVDDVRVEVRGERRYLIVRLQRGTPMNTGEEVLRRCLRRLFSHDGQMVTA
jgi:hypothetical protein